MEQNGNVIQVEYSREINVQQQLEGESKLLKQYQNIKFSMEIVSTERMNSHYTYLKTLKDLKWLPICDIENIDSFPAPFRDKMKYNGYVKRVKVHLFNLYDYFTNIEIFYKQSIPTEDRDIDDIFEDIK